MANKFCITKLKEGSMKTGTRVKNRVDGQMGYVIVDSFRCCSDEEDLVVYDGSKIGFGTDKKILEEVEWIMPIPDLFKCGGGKKEDCCIFLTLSGDGPCCERFTSLRDSLIFKTMSAKRNPVEPYPECMKF